MVRRSSLALFVLLLSLTLVPAAGVRAEPSSPAAEEDDDYELQRMLVDTIDQVQRNYVKEISRRQIVEAAIRGILEELDPYSAYISPEEMRGFRTSVESQFGGIGIQVEVKDGGLKVLSPLVGTPAYRAGVIAGDRITKIDGESTEGFSLGDAVKKLKGPEGTEVTLTVVHPDSEAEEDLAVTREVIHVETVLGDHRKADDSWDFMADHDRGIGYVRVVAFSRTTARELRKAMDGLVKEGLRGLVLDLRDNPGGLLSSAIEISDQFVSQGKIVSAEGRNVSERSWNAKKSGTYEGFPMVVLVNRYTASASEIVSACLQDNHRAVVMGERTWGKGSIQNVIELEKTPDEPYARSALKLTTSGYVRPNGHNIHRSEDSSESDEWGVTPNDGYQMRLTYAELLDIRERNRRRDIVRSTRRPGAAGPEESPPESAPAEEEPAEEPPAGEQPAEAEPSEEGPPEAGPDDQPEEEPDAPEVEPPPNPYEIEAEEEAAFVDPHLRMAMDYLGSELAKADPAPAAKQ